LRARNSRVRTDDSGIHKVVGGASNHIRRAVRIRLDPQCAGPVDLEFGWPGDFGDPKRELRIRVQSSRSGGVWMFIERD